MNQASGWGTTPRRTARRIIREATKRQLRPGDRLAREQTLIEFFGVSRQTMRNALGLLTFLGAVEGVAGNTGGTRMATPNTDALTSSLGMVLQATDADLSTVFDALAGVAPIASQFAAERHDPAGVQDLMQLLADLDPRSDAATFAAAVQRFDVAVAHASGNAALAAFVEALSRITNLEPIDTTPAQRRTLHRHTTAIADAITSRDADQAHTATTDSWKYRRRQLDTHHRSTLRRHLEWPDIDELLDR